MKKIKLLLYCTKSKKRLFFDKVKEIFTLGKVKSNNDLNGKIVAECDYEVEEIRADWGSNHIGNIEIDDRYDYYVNSLKDEYELCKKSCLTMEELDNYLKGKNGYAIHIKNLNIFDEPRELSDYCLYPKNIKGVIYFVLEGTPHIVLSVSPQEMCRICNDEQTVLVRKKVLKEMG